jgi:hypothetical protein
MKKELQLEYLFSTCPFKSEMDWNMVIDYCEKSLKYKTGDAPTFSPDGLTASGFIEWFQNGFGVGDVVWYNGALTIIGRCDLSEANIEGRLIDDKIDVTRSKTSISQFTHASPEERLQFIRAMSQAGLQFGENNMLLVAKYIPSVNERVIFHNDDRLGVGVVRSVDVVSGEVELYCYYIYQTDELGYSMHEKGVCNLHEYYFDPASEMESRQTKLNGKGCLKRLNMELEKVGKKWKDKLHRIEPLKVKVDVGYKYWYISDKMKVVQDREKDTPTSQFRYQVGNYFASFEDCLDYLGKFTELLRDRLARPEDLGEEL